MEELKVFKVCETDSVCAKTKEEAREWYLKETGLSDEEVYPLDEIDECDLDKEKINYLEDGTENDLVTFREALKRDIESGIFNIPYIFSSTEY